MWQIYTYAYNGAGQRMAKTANGQTASYLLKNAHGDVMQTIIAYTYDVRNRLVKEENGHSGTTTTYQFDIRNNITQKTVYGAENYTERYVYTAAHTDGYQSNRIIEVTKESGDGTIGRTYYYQKPNGNTYQKVVMNGNWEPVEVSDYTYNAWNLMDSASVLRGNTETKATFEYDATGRRIGKKTEVYENGQRTEAKTTEYIWYGDKVQYEEVTQSRAVL